MESRAEMESARGCPARPGAKDTCRPGGGARPVPRPPGRAWTRSHPPGRGWTEGVVSILVLLVAFPAAGGIGGPPAGGAGRDGAAPSGGPAARAAVAGQEAPIRIGFETWPDGEPACERCPISDEFRDLGVVFAFFSPFAGETEAHLVASGAYDPEGEERNHAVTSALGEEGFRPGVLSLSFPEAPRRVAFRLRGSDAVPAFTVRAVGSDGTPLPEAAVERAAVRAYRASGGGAFREERIAVETAAGISRVELDGTGPPGHILLVDDLAIWPAAGSGSAGPAPGSGPGGTGIGAER